MYRGKARLSMTQQVDPCTEHTQTRLLTMNTYIYTNKAFLVAGHSKVFLGPMPCCKYATVCACAFYKLITNYLLYFAWADKRV